MGMKRGRGSLCMLVLLVIRCCQDGVVLSVKGLPEEQKPSVSQLFGTLPQRGNAKVLSTVGPRFDTCELASWLPTASTVNTTVFLGLGAYMGSQACGMCVAYREEGADTVKYGIVGGWCPTCRTQDLGISSNAGEFLVGGDVVWAPVQCDTGCQTITYELGINFDLQILSVKFLITRVPMETVELFDGANWVPMEIVEGGFWRVASGVLFISFPPPQLQLRMYTVLGDRLDDIVTAVEWGPFQGKLYAARALQQPVNLNFASMLPNEPSCGALPPTPEPTPVPTRPSGTLTPSPTDTPAVTAEPTPHSTADIPRETPGPSPPVSGSTPAPPLPAIVGQLSDEWIPNFFQPSGNPPVMPWPPQQIPIPGELVPLTVQTKSVASAPSVEDCLSCVNKGISYVCNQAGKVYANACFASVCEGLTISEVSIDLCP